jgi:hypothetical protein
MVTVIIKARAETKSIHNRREGDFEYDLAAASASSLAAVGIASSSLALELVPVGHFMLYPG